MRGWALAAVTCAACEFGRLPALPIDVDAAVDAPIDARYDLPCLGQPEYIGRAGTTHRYHLITTALDYDAAVDACAADGAHLVAVDDSVENDYVKSLVTTDSWIGFDDLTREAVFRWVTGSQLGFTAWAAGQPDDQPLEDCATISTTGTWRDVGCAVARPPVCECDPGYQPPATPACRSTAGAETVNGRRYFVRTTPATWAAAAVDCSTIGAYLVAISDLDENAVIDTRFDTDAWIGLSDLQIEGNFRWVNKAPSGYVHWATDAPTAPGGESEDCVVLEHPVGTWNDTSCAALRPYACECDPAPP